MEPASPSLITVELSVENGEVKSLMAGGYGKILKSLSVDY
jgi:hypothetical protein